MSKQSKAKLAREANISMEDLEMWLSELGIKSRSRLSGADLRQVRLSLDLPINRPDPTEVRILAERANIPESEARSRLTQGGCLAKRRLKRVPRPMLQRAEEILGITEILEHSVNQTVVDREQGEPEKKQKKRKKKALKEKQRIIGPEEEL